MIFPDAALLAIIACSAFYDLLTTALLRRWGKRQKMLGRGVAGGAGDHGSDDVFPPVTLLRPVKRGVPGLGEKLAMLAAAARPGDQILVGVEDAESEASARAIPGVEVVRCGAGQARNPKINKLAQMAPLAREERWIISDSEALMTREFLDALRADWRLGEVVTAGYRFVGARSLPERLDHAAALLSLWPGLMLAPRRFTLGACTGLRRADLAAIGGWEALADYLAEDSRLGGLLARAGRRIIFSRAILPLEGDRVSAGCYLRHQLRVALTYRVSAPAGYFGMGLTHGISAALLLVLCARGAGWAWILFAGMWLLRTAAAAQNGRALGFTLRPLALITLLHSVVESVGWVASWFLPGVYWNGRWLRISREGKILSAPAAADEAELPAEAAALAAAATILPPARDQSAPGDAGHSRHISYPAGLRRSG